MPKRSKIIDQDRGYNRILRELATMGSPSVTIGIHGDDNKPYQRGQTDPVTTAQIGTFHEFGTLDRFEDTSPAGDGSGKRGVPQRSFLRSTVDENRQKYANLITRATAQVIDGKMPVERALGLVGAAVVGDVQQKIAKGIEPSLTEAGIKSKVKPSTKPLIDTGQLRQAIDYQVQK